MATKQRIPKRKDRAFGKDVYLLGIDKDGQYVWLEQATWDCGWYWGFGYIERYNIGRGKNPHLASDIRSHTHWDSGIIGKHEKYDFEKKAFVLSSDYIHHINEHPDFKATTLSEKESWKLSEYMSTVYTLKESAEMFGRGGSHLSSDDYEEEVVRREEWAKEINEVILPKLFNAIYVLLSHDEETGLPV